MVSSTEEHSASAVDFVEIRTGSVEEREEGRRLRELLLLVYDKKGHGRDPEHDSGELHQVLSGVSLPSFHGSWGKGERDSIGSIAILTFLWIPRSFVPDCIFVA